MADHESPDDVAERRRRGRELQSRLPRRRRPPTRRSTAVGDTVEAGCCALEAVELFGLVVAATVAATLVVRTLHRRRSD